MAISLVKALKDYFEIPGSVMVREFKQLTEKDKDDFVAMFHDIGMDVERSAA